MPMICDGISVCHLAVEAANVSETIIGPGMNPVSLRPVRTATGIMMEEMNRAINFLDIDELHQSDFYGKID